MGIINGEKISIIFPALMMTASFHQVLVTPGLPVINLIVINRTVINLTVISLAAMILEAICLVVINLAVIGRVVINLAAINMAMSYQTILLVKVTAASCMVIPPTIHITTHMATHQLPIATVTVVTPPVMVRVVLTGVTLTTVVTLEVTV